MNKVILIGNLVRDPELKTTSSGTSTCAFTIAVNRRFKNQQGVQETDYINIVTWRQTAELCVKYLVKGRKVGIVGSIQTRSYTSTKDNQKKYVTEVIAEEVDFLTPKNQADGSSESYSAAQTSKHGGESGFTEVSDDELPF